MVGAQLVSVAVAIPVCLRFHPAPTYRIAVGFFAAALVGFLLLWRSGNTQVHWVYALMILAGLGRGALNYIPWSVYNYMPDVDEIVTGRRREGAFAGVMTFVRKVMQSAAILLATQVLNLAGLIPKTMNQPASVVTTVVVILACGPLLIMLFGLFVSLRFRLNSETHGILMDEIDRFKRNDGSEPAPENRAIVEDLTGWKYEQLWGKGKPS
jgi:oligogalacturonide transporter